MHPSGDRQLIASVTTAEEGPGEELGVYRVEKELGRGAMGIVYRAYHRTLERPCALKVLQRGLGKHAVERFVIEGRASAKLGKHPNIVQVFDAGVADGWAYIAMELVEGEPLDELLERGGKLSPDEALRIAHLLARALDHAHSCDIIHRDMKPGNVIIARDGTPLVLDFGLAKHRHQDSQASAAGNIIGTPNYMPPEQADPDRGAVDQRSDVYSLGATLYHMLTGKLPFTSKEIVDTLVQVLMRDPPPVRLNAKVSDDLEAVVAKAMEKDKHARYATAREFAEDLERARAGEPTFARPIGMLERQWRKVRRHAGVALMSLLLLVFAGASTAFVLERRAEAEQMWQQAYERSAREATAEVRGLLEPAIPLLREMTNLGQLGMLPDADEVELAKRLAVHYRYREGLDWLSYGDEQGRYAGARREDDGSIVINHSHFVGAKNKLLEERFGEDGERAVTKRDDDWDFDHRKRGWYLLASRSKGAVWTEPYVWYDGGYGITLTTALRDDAGERQGCFTADFRLRRISDFLAGLDLGAPGEVYLLTRDGTVFARSDKAGDKAPHPVLDAAMAAGDVPLEKLPVDQPSAFEFEHEGTEYAAALEAFQVEGGIEWVAATLVPTEAMRGNVATATTVAIAVGLALVLATMGAGVFVSVRRRRRLMG